MTWYFLNTGSNTGEHNMKFDSELAARGGPGQAFLRLYRWKPYCLSLGNMQRIEDINIERVANDGLDIVVRPTGGRAVLHAEELTYSVVLPVDKVMTPQVIYRQINEALLKGLSLYNHRLALSSLEQVQPDFRKIYQSSQGMACFAASAKNELKLEHKKLVGSAQRKIGDIVLQHGSILCGTFHKNIVNYLNLTDTNIAALKSEIDNKTTEIETITGSAVDYEHLADCIKTGFSEYFSVKLSDVNESGSHVLTGINTVESVL